LFYHQGENVLPHDYSNNDYYGNLDEKKSTFGYVFSLGTAPTSWKSKLQHEVAQSSVEIKYYAMNETTRNGN
jgi:hypothetical protein